MVSNGTSVSESWFGLASGFGISLIFGLRHWFGVRIGGGVWHSVGFGFGFIRLGVRVQLGVGVRQQARLWGLALGFGFASGFSVGLGVGVRLGVGLASGAATGSALGLVLVYGFDVGVWCLQGRSGFDSCVLLSLYPWGGSGSMTRSSWYGQEVFAFFLST